VVQMELQLEAEKAQQEQALEREKAEDKMSIDERKFQHELSMKEREMAMREEEHRQDAQLKLDLHEHTKKIATQQAESQALAAQTNQINAQRSQSKE